METALLAAVALLCLAWVLSPVILGGRSRLLVSRSDTPVGRQELRKELILGNIADLDFEYAMGKLSDDDYRELRESLKAQAAAVTEQIDVLQQGGELVGGDGPTGRAARAPQAVAAAAATTTHGGNGAESDGARPAVARFCVECGTGLPAGARFCPACGKQVPA